MLQVNKIEEVKQWLVEVMQRRTQHWSEKVISVFLVLQGSAEALIKWGEKIYHLLIACFLLNTLVPKIIEI